MRHGRDWTIATNKKKAEGRCRIPGCHDRNTQAAHVIDRSIGGGQDHADTIPLCQKHHQLYDTYELDLLPYLTYAEQAAAVAKVGIVRALERISPDHNPRKQPYKGAA